ncbi:hypothetical protein [Amycolatopsis orientalis]|uniref:hypothetical protein n=1 Tax=Amycolatopsis orientalis TaxID=31958 RepID=UPI0011AB7AB7|nr:hypothetical protein [Amycolatopsis orientalis]
MLFDESEPEWWQVVTVRFNSLDTVEQDLNDVVATFAVAMKEQLRVTERVLPQAERAIAGPLQVD